MELEKLVNQSFNEILDGLQLLENYAFLLWNAVANSEDTISRDLLDDVTLNLESALKSLHDRTENAYDGILRAEKAAKA